MKLTYRGRTYNHTLPTVDVAELSQEGIFLGKGYKMKKFSVSTRRQVPAEMTYRGVHYTR